MRVNNAYRIEKFVSKLHIHALDMLVWYTLRFYLNKRLPSYYRKHDFRDRKSLQEYTDRAVILSLTTYPKRMETLPLVVESLLRQTVRPTSFQLWLAEEQYPDKETLLRDMKPYMDRGLEILFCDDLKSHKKYYYTMKNNPDAIVVTVDDDIIYPENMLEELLETHMKYPDCVVTHRAHKMTKKNGTVLPYNNWNYRAVGCIGPDLYLCATGCGGCLYPPKLLPEEVFNKEVFKEMCFFADDLWLKCMEYINKIPVVLTGANNPEVISVLGSNDGGLAQSNVEDNKNDLQFRAVSEYYNIKW